MHITKKTHLLISLVVFFVVGLFLNTHGQKLVNEKLYASSVKDSIEVKVWLPRNYDSKKSYPVIYEFVYDHSDYIAATINHLYGYPSAIVVHARFMPGTSYKKPTLSDKGAKHYQFVKDELLPYIKKKYKTRHKTATGLSQGADYVNYILRTNPELFDAYMIFAIEAPYYQADFAAYTDKLKKKKDYYIAIANDTKRRVKFANELYTNLSKSEKLNVKKQEFKLAEHSYAMLYALAEGLLFIYKDYLSYRDKKPAETLSQYYTNIVNEIEEKFGTINYNGLLIKISNKLTKESSKTEVKTLLEKLYKDKVNISDLDLFNMGYTLYEALGFYALSEATFRQSIERGKNLPVDKRRMQLPYTYSWLASVCYKQKAYAKVFSTLREGYKTTKAKFLLRRYATYSFLIEDNKQIKKGIEALNTLVALPKSENVHRNPEQPKDVVYLLYAKGYWKLKNESESRKYLKMALEINPKNKSALEFQKTIQ